MRDCENDYSQPWREARERVRAAEVRVAGAWSDYASGKGGPPSRETIAELADLRRDCDRELATLLKRISARRRDDAERRA